MYSYYAAPARIRYFGKIPDSVRIEKDAGNVDRLYASQQTKAADPGKWRDAPHVVLANLPSDETGWPGLKTIERFTWLYGVLGERQSTTRCTIDPGKVWGMQTLLQQAWRGELQGLDSIVMDDLAHETEISFTGEGMELRVSDLWTLIRLLFLRDHAAGRARICAIEDCPRTPYFLQDRKGQKFCSQPCAVLSNVRRFRKRRAMEKSHRRKSKRR